MVSLCLTRRRKVTDCPGPIAGESIGDRVRRLTLGQSRGQNFEADGGDLIASGRRDRHRVTLKDLGRRGRQGTADDIARSRLTPGAVEIEEASYGERDLGGRASRAAEATRIVGLVRLGLATGKFKRACRIPQRRGHRHRSLDVHCPRIANGDVGDCIDDVDSKVCHGEGRQQSGKPGANIRRKVWADGESERLPG